jgi:D-sedoheptulose 7-phosphate isomerase
MTFPDRKYDAAGAFLDDYAREVTKAFASVDRAAIAKATDLLSATHKRDGTIWCCGNGGSAAIANHLVCDHVKGVATDTALKPRVHSLSANIEVITAIANDLSYADVFAYQLRMGARPGDALITISSSGDSENIVRAATWARENKLPVIAMTGFAGGRSAGLADAHLHVQAENYGVVEDVHQALMHVLAQYLRQAAMPENLISPRKF